jgi:hypothetical protein
VAQDAIYLPDDTGNQAGVPDNPPVRTNTRDIGGGGELRHEHYYNVAGGEGSAVATVAASGTSVTLAAANQDRVGLMIANDSVDSVLFVKLGGTASTTSFSKKLLPGDDWAMPVPYAGVVDGIWTNGAGAVSGNARVTEITPD